MNDESRPRQAAPGSGGPAPIVAGTPDSSQLQLAFADRAEGIAANQAANESVVNDGRQRVEDAITRLAESGESFTADDLHHEVLRANPDPYDRLLLASAIGNWSRSGKILEDWQRRPVPSTQRSRHGSRLRWWYGNPSANPSGNPFGNPVSEVVGSSVMRHGDAEVQRHGDAGVERHAEVDRDVTAQSPVTGFLPESLRNPSGVRPDTPRESPGDRGA